jgi:GT2 family glycosyltransferase
VPPPRVSVVTVNFNAGRHLLACARAALASSVPVDMFVVDNRSLDSSVAELRGALGGDARLTLLENAANLGFARANNLALGRAQGEFLLLLNPDCLVQPDTLERLLPLFDRFPDAGMLGPLIRNPDGTEQAGCRRREPTAARAFVRAFGLDRFGPLREHGIVQRDDPLPPGPAEVDAISGAFMLVRKSALAQVGPLDDGYFLHCEDLDWCKRFRSAGWRVLFVPDVAVVHDKGSSSRDRPVRVLWHMHRGMLRYYWKFTGGPAALLLPVVAAAVWARFAVLALVSLLRPRARGRAG